MLVSSVEATEGLERRMTVEVPQEQIEQEVQNRLQRLARTTKLKGFRPGKVPLKVVQQQYGQQVRLEVVGEVMQSTYYQAIAQENLRPAGHPSIEPESIEPGQNLKFTATFEVLPEVELASLAGVTLEKVTAGVSDADVEKVIENLRRQRTEWNDAERAAEAGDRVTIDFRGTIDGEEFQGNKGTDVPVVLGSGRMIPGFEEGLTGASAGDERTVDVTFPEDYGYKEVAGKPAQFAITVKKVEAPKLPEVDDALAASFGVSEGGAEALRAEVRKNMERELDRALVNLNKQAVMDKLLELNDVELPKALVEHESAQLMEQMKQQMHTPAGKSGVELDPGMFTDQAARRVRLGLLLSEAIKRGELKATPDDVRAKVDEVASTYEQPEEVVRYYMGDAKRLQEIESLCLEEKVVDWVFEQADVAETKKSFEEIMNPGNQG